MRFLLGVLVGYSMRGTKELLITVLATVAFIVYIHLGKLRRHSGLNEKLSNQARPTIGQGLEEHD